MTQTEGSTVTATIQVYVKAQNYYGMHLAVAGNAHPSLPISKRYVEQTFLTIPVLSILSGSSEISEKLKS